MSFVEHYRVSMIGRLGGVSGPEQFSCNLALARFNQDDVGIIAPGALDPNAAVWEDVASDCGDWFAREESRIHPDARLLIVKIAHIGSDGRYMSAPVEIPQSVGGNFDGGGRHPNQVAYAVSLRTAGDLGRVKGRFYAPLPSVAVDVDGTISETVAEIMEGSARTLINALNNQPGLDVLDLNVAVASQGRRNKNGTMRVPPRNHRVTGVGVGRVLDTQRRRRNKLAESRDWSAL